MYVWCVYVSIQPMLFYYITRYNRFILKTDIQRTISFYEKPGSN